jgi:hypothetical protein
MEGQQLRVALVTANAQNAVLQLLEHNPHELLAALEQCGMAAETVAWNDPTIDWSRFQFALLSTVRQPSLPLHNTSPGRQRCVSLRLASNPTPRPVN